LNDLEGIREIGDWKDAKRVACVFRQCWEGELVNISGKA
jgi:hypothetical protein